MVLPWPKTRLRCTLRRYLQSFGLVGDNPSGKNRGAPRPAYPAGQPRQTGFTRMKIKDLTRNELAYGLKRKDGAAAAAGVRRAETPDRVLTAMALTVAGAVAAK